MSINLATREEKLAVFRVHASERCPGCGGYKTRLHWLCIPCQQAVDSTPENVALTLACSAHVRAAEALIAAVKAAPHTSEKAA